MQNSYVEATECPYARDDVDISNSVLLNIKKSPTVPDTRTPYEQQVLRMFAKAHHLGKLKNFEIVKIIY